MSISLLPSPASAAVLLNLAGNFLLRSSVAFAACFAAAKLIATPRARFVVWLGWLTGAAAFWMVTLARMAAALRPAAAAGAASATTAAPARLLLITAAGAHRVAAGAVVFVALYTGALLALAVVGLVRRIGLRRAVAGSPGTAL